MSKTDQSELRALIERAIAKDDDHMVATGDNLTWLLAQLVCWPTRVHPRRTTNDRFIRISMAATTLALLDRVAELEVALAEIAAMTDQDNPDSYRADDREGCLDAVQARARTALRARAALDEKEMGL